MPQFWFCNECKSKFGTPRYNTKTKEEHCLFCGSKKIKKRWNGKYEMPSL